MRRTLAIFCIAFAFLGSANAVVLTFQFSGSVTQVPVDEVFGDISIGDAIQGSYRFDTSALDQTPADPAAGSFTWSAPFGMTVKIGAHDFSASGSLNIGILNSFVDQYTVLALSGTGGLTLELFLQDNTGSVFSSDELPVTAPPLDSFGLKDFHLQALLADREVQVDGQILTLGPLAVPEVSPAGLVLAGSILLILARRRRRS